MALSTSDAIGLLEDGLRRLVSMITAAGDAARVPRLPLAWDRRDLYALITIGQVGELAAGVLDERRAGRRTNAVRLARHLFEYDVESAWVLAAPETRVRRVFAEEMRRMCDEIPAEHTAHLDLSAVRPLVAEVRASLTRGERGNHGEFIPSRWKMAQEVGADATYRSEYAAMSWVAHPGLNAGVRFLRLVSEDGDLLARPAHDPRSEVLPISNGAYSCARCYRRLAPEIGSVVDEPQVREVMATIEMVAQAVALGE